MEGRASIGTLCRRLNSHPATIQASEYAKPRVVEQLGGVSLGHRASDDAIALEPAIWLFAAKDGLAGERQDGANCART